MTNVEKIANAIVFTNRSHGTYCAVIDSAGNEQMSGVVEIMGGAQRLRMNEVDFVVIDITCGDEFAPINFNELRNALAAEIDRNKLGYKIGIGEEPDWVIAARNYDFD